MFRHFSNERECTGLDQKNVAIINGYSGAKFIVIHTSIALDISLLVIYI